MNVHSRLIALVMFQVCRRRAGVRVESLSAVCSTFIDVGGLYAEEAWHESYIGLMGMTFAGVTLRGDGRKPERTFTDQCRGCANATWKSRRGTEPPGRNTQRRCLLYIYSLPAGIYRHHSSPGLQAYGCERHELQLGKHSLNLDLQVGRSSKWYITTTRPQSRRDRRCHQPVSEKQLPPAANVRTIATGANGAGVSPATNGSFEPVVLSSMRRLMSVTAMVRIKPLDVRCQHIDSVRTAPCWCPSMIHSDFGLFAIAHANWEAQCAVVNLITKAAYDFTAPLLVLSHYKLTE